MDATPLAHINSLVLLYSKIRTYASSLKMICYTISQSKNTRVNRLNNPYTCLTVLLAATALVGCHLARNSEMKPDYRQAIGQGAIILARAMDEIRTPAISIAVGVDNRVVWAAARGYQDLENRLPADTITQFRVGSCSKPVTAMAMGKLLE